MSCCGGQRIGISQPTHIARSAGRPLPTVDFIYTGGTSLTVIGGASGRAYRFAHSGCSLPVDARDAPGMSGIRSLHRAR